GHPARSAAQRRGGRGRGARRAAGAGLAPGHSRRPAHAHGVERRARLRRGDGRRVPGARLRVHGDHRPFAALGRVAQPLDRRRGAAGGRNRAAARALSRHRDPAWLRGRHPRDRLARFPRQGARAVRPGARVAARIARARARSPAGSVCAGDAAPAGDADYPPHQPPRPDPGRIRPRLRALLRDRRGDRNAARDRWRAGAPGSRRRSRASGDRSRGDRLHRQRLPPRRPARAADDARPRDGAPRLGRSAARPQHAPARRGAPRRGGEARAVTRAAALAAGVLVFALYYATLLPGVDFGDTGSFQATVGTPLLTPRDAYPLYFAIGGAFAGVTGLEPARALNLASAVEGAVAAGLLVLVGAELSGSIVAGLATSLLFATSYTFWSQAIIAEVYALHACFVAATVLLLLRWAARPTIGRLAAFFAVFA